MAVTNKRGIFALLDVRERQGAGVWSTRGDVWLSPSPFNAPSPAPFGYLGGGYTASENISIVDRIDYSNDTASSLIKGPLTAVRRGAAGVSNGSFGYFGGGTPGNTNLERIDYANDTATALSRGPLSHNDFNNNAGTSNLSFGYFAGGGSPITSEVDRVDFSNDTATALAKGPLTIIRQEFSGTGNLSFGYFAGGETPGLVSSVDRIDYGNDTATMSPKGPLSSAKKFAMGSGNSDFGYFSGGQAPSHLSTVDRVDYSNDTAAAAVKGPLSSTATLGSATGNSSFGYVFGYYGGTSDRIDYGNDTATALTRGSIYNIGGYRYWTGATSRKENGHPDTSNISPVADNFGYFGGGHPSLSIVDRIDYSNDTATAAVKGPIGFSASYGRKELAATSSSLFGYFGGGYSSLGGNRSDVERVDYSNDTATAAAKGPLSVARKTLAATGNASFGYFGGGGPGNYSTVDRVNYGNDTATAVAKGPLSVGRRHLAATGNQDFGYFIAGASSGWLNQIDRIDYSNDTATASPKGPLASPGIAYLAATGNADFGYVGGGKTPFSKSTVERIDYSNDTATAVEKGPLSAARYSLAATGNVSFGYFGGGGAPGKSIVDRIDYSNDTATASPKGPLSAARYSLAATSAAANALPTDNGIIDNLLHTAAEPRENVAPQGTDFGYFGGGDGPSGNVSTIDRVDYSNDTAAATPKGPLGAAERQAAATSSSFSGYFATSVNPRKSTIQRIDYSNDTVTAAAKGPLTSARRYQAGTGNSSFGYFGAGDGPSADLTSVDRIDYTNDTATASPKGPLTLARQLLAATGNQNFGYFGGGESPYLSIVDRIDYTNDTATASPKGPLIVARLRHAATGNASFGYFSGGDPGGTRVGRIDYSNDTATAVEKGQLTAARVSLSATGNADFGYFGSGQSVPSLSGLKSIVDRIDYSNDTATASPKGPLSVGRQELAASSSRANGMPLKGPAVLEVPVSFGNFSRTVPQVGFNNGYFSGGFQPANSPSFPSSVEYSSVARIDYSNDTTTVPARGSLTDVRYSHAGTGNSNFGYHGGGGPYSPSTNDWKTSIERIDYSNDTATASLKGQLSDGTNALAAVSSASHGYFAGGTSPTISTVQRIDYGNDTATAVAKGPLSLARFSLSSTGNQSFGYNIGGYLFPAPVYIRSTIDRIDYSNDTATASPKGPLSVQRDKTGSTGNADFGYAAGGYNVVPGGNNWVSLIDRIDYSNDTATASPKGPLSRTRGFGCATGDSSFGYFGGGEGNNNENLSALDRLDYSNDTATTVDKGPLSYSLRNSAASSSLANANPPFSPSIANYASGTLATHNKGYFFGKWANGSSIHRIDYSNDDFTTLSTTLLQPGYGGAGLSSRIHAYHVGGTSPSSSMGSSTQRINYFNDTITQVHPVPNVPSPGSRRVTGIFNDNYGWYVFENVTTFRRIEFSNDGVAPTPKGNLLTAGNFIEATVGNSSYGYFHRGGPSYQSTIQRIDYSNDTATAVAKGPLPLAIEQTAGTGTSDYGYIGGGAHAPGSISNIHRIDYSNDTATAPSRNNLWGTQTRMTATGNSSSGYFSGYPSAPTNLSAFSRIDFSNDTAAVTTNISTGDNFIWWLGAASAKEFGLNNIGPALVENTVTQVYPYTVFGYFRTNSSNVNRVNFANDIEGGVHLSNTLSSGTQSKSMAYSSSTHAYFSRQDTERIDYSNDTAAFVTVGGMPTARYEGAAVQSLTHGYVLGGFASSVYRLDFANDTATMSTRGNLADTRREFGAAGNLTHAYIMGDGDAMKIDYSNDTATATYLSPVIPGSGNTYATGSLTHGYLATSDYIQKFDYSNDTASPSSYNQFATSLGSNGGASGNADFGYFVGRSNKDLQRLNFANDTVTPKTRGSLANNSEQYGAGTSTAEFGLRG